MANAFEKAFKDRHVKSKPDKPTVTYKEPKRTRSRAAVDYMQRTNCTLGQAARKYSLTPAAVSLQIKYMREEEYCPTCGRKYPRR